MSQAFATGSEISMTNPVLQRVSESAKGTRGFAKMREDRIGSVLDEKDQNPGSPGSSVSVDGVVSKTGALTVIAAAAAWFGWMNPQLSALMIPAMLLSFGLSIVTVFRPFAAKITAPMYAVAQGFALGMLSVYFEASYPGIARDALGISGAVFGVLLIAYARRWVTVTARMRSTVMVATLGIAVYYLVNLGASVFFGTSLPLVSSNSGAGILFSVAVAGLAAWNFLLDFDSIERSVANGADQRYEWALSFGVLVTFAWLYIEILRLLSKLRSR